MSQSLDIIRHILDENLIDAKKATEGYLNDILSVAIREQYKEVAPDMFEAAEGGGNAVGGAPVGAAAFKPGNAPAKGAGMGSGPGVPDPPDPNAPITSLSGSDSQLVRLADGIAPNSDSMYPGGAIWEAMGWTSYGDAFGQIQSILGGQAATTWGASFPF
tara:strand:- start:2 stop:481 length:480 start_codon:yes stop_codon:yes gene_type:complete